MLWPARYRLQSQIKAVRDRQNHLLVQLCLRATAQSLIFSLCAFQVVYLKLDAPTVEMWLRITRVQYAPHWPGKGNMSASWTLCIFYFAVQWKRGHFRSIREFQPPTLFSFSSINCLHFTQLFWNVSILFGDFSESPWYRKSVNVNNLTSKLAQHYMF